MPIPIPVPILTGARGTGARPERSGLELLDGRRVGDTGEIQSRGDIGEMYGRSRFSVAGMGALGEEGGGEEGGEAEAAGGGGSGKMGKI